MEKGDRPPEPQSAGNRPPPRPPRPPTIGLGPEDDDSEIRRDPPPKQTVRINMPPKPSAVPTIRLPTLPAGTRVPAGATEKKRPWWKFW